MVPVLERGTRVHQSLDERYMSVRARRRRDIVPTSLCGAPPRLSLLVAMLYGRKRFVLWWRSMCGWGSLLVM